MGIEKVPKKRYDYHMSNLPEKVIERATAHEIRICCAESITGGRIASALTSVSGASKVFYSGIVTYDLDAKVKFLEIPAEFFDEHNVYSAECAVEMAENWRKKCDAHICISTTGQAVASGQIFFGVSIDRSDSVSHTQFFTGDRNEIQEQATQFALQLFLDEMK